MYNICHVIFSTNRLEYLIPTLRAQQNLNFFGCNVEKIFIDDFPKGRNNNLIKALVSLYGFKELYLHEENKGLSVTWTEFWNLISKRNYDYVFHQEDDIEILEPILITDLIEILENNQDVSQVQLRRQPWYTGETESVPEDDDIIYKNFRFKKGHRIFSPMASLYHLDITKINYKEIYNFNLNEGLIGNALLTQHSKTSANVKNFYGKNLIKHIGEWTVGRRILPGEPGYENWSYMDPEKKYGSRFGDLY